MVFCTLPGCTNQFESRTKDHRFCCPAHRARFAYLPVKKENQQKRNDRFRSRNRDRYLGFLDGRYSGPEGTAYCVAPVAIQREKAR
jgi:hypothetical protein